MSHLNINGVDKPLDHVYVKARTENLFDWYAATTGYRIQWLTGESFADANAIMSDFIPVSAGIYCANASFNLVGYDENRTYVGTYDPNTRTFRKEYGNKTSYYGISDSNVAYVKLLSFANTDTLSESTMFNTGAAVKPYEPYLITKEAWEARTRVILHNLTNPLCGIRTYKDTLDLSTGTLTRYIKKLVLNGTENWAQQNAASGKRFNLYVAGAKQSDTGTVASICTHFPLTVVGCTYNYDNTHTINNAEYLYIRMDATTTLNSFKQYLAAQYAAGTPVVIWYVLATPETETITVPSNLTGIVEGYLTQSSTPSPTSPVYPTANGTLEQGGTYSLDTGAYAIAWGRADTFTGTDSMSARCYGLPIKSWEIDGNSQQNGTPTPDAPIMPEFVGERTANLWDGKSILVLPDIGTRYGFYCAAGDYSVRNDSENIVFMFLQNGLTRLEAAQPHTTATITLPINRGTGFFMPYNDASLSNITIVDGSDIPSQQIPYGYALPITSAGQTQNVYLGQVQTTRRVKKLVLDGTENWSTQNVGPHRAVSIRKDELPLTPNMQVGTLNILSTHFKSIGDVSQLDVGKMASGSSYLNFDYDGINNVTNFKSFLAAQYSAGTPVTIWYVLANEETSIVNEPLCKIGTYVDTLTSEQAGITIPTTDGNNIISVDTSLAPSKMTITGHIRDVWFEQSITGVPPLSFKANGKPLISWSMLGNGQQNGTPAHDAPIMPDFVGERTGNLAPPLTEWVDGYVASDGTIQPPDMIAQQKSSGYISVAAGETYTFSRETGFPIGETVPWRGIGWYTQDKIFISRESDNVSDALSTRVPSNAAYCRLSYRTYGEKTNPVFNVGSTPLPYEPYGYKIPITCAGQTTPVYLGQTQTVRRVQKLVLDGTENWKLGSGATPYPYIARADMPNAYIANSPLFCTHFVNGGTGMMIGSSYALLTNYTGIAIDVATWKTWLQQQYANGTPVTVWYVLATPENAIVNEPLAKIGTYADTLDSADAGITIPTAKGANTLTVDTELPPSEMTITGYIKAIDQ